MSINSQFKKSGANGKKTYRKPSFYSYGQLTEITRGGVGSKSEGMGMGMGMGMSKVTKP